MVKRTLKHHQERKNEILDAAQRLFTGQGYDATPVSAILDAVGVAKGTFYHYFQSKEDLLDSLVARATELIVSQMRQAAEREDLDAVSKLNACFSAAGRWKTENRDALLAIIKPVYSLANIVPRHKMNERTSESVVPLLAGIVRQGVREGVFRTDYPDEAAEIILGIGYAFQNSNVALVLTIEEHPENWELLRRRFACMANAVEGVLGASPGSLTLVDMPFLDALRPSDKEGA